MTAHPTTPKARAAPASHSAPHPSRPTSSALRRLGQGREARRLLMVSAALSAAQLICTVAAWLLAARLINALTFEVRPVASVWPALAGLAALFTLRALLAAARESVNGTTATRLVAGLRARLLARLGALGPVALSDLLGAELATSAQAGVSRLTPYFARYLPQAAHAGVYALGILAALLITDPLSALIVAVTLPISIVFLWLVGLAAGEATRRQWTGLSRLNARLVGAARTLPTLRAYGAAHARAEGLASEAQAHRAATLTVLRAAFLNGFVLDLAATLSVALVAVTVGVRLFEDHLTFAPALAALLLVPEAFAPMRQLGSDRHAAMEAEPAAERVLDLLEMPTVPEGKMIVDGLPGIELRGVTAVLAGQPVLSNLSLSVPAGGRVAVTGPSGSGKTTLLHGLLKYLPLDGRAEVNDVSLADLDTAAWRAGAAFVTQRPRFLAGSIRANLLAVDLDASKADLGRALGVVGLSADLATPISEDGHPLSGGQRARLALARALLSDAPLLLLDEPTAHLDPRAEAELLDRLAPHLKGRTVVLATHRHVPAGFERYELRDGRLYAAPERVPA